jgi:hypothetical protein
MSHNPIKKYKEYSMSVYREKNIWAILGVSEEAKKKAKDTAKLEKKSIGEYIDDLILNSKISDNSQELKIIKLQLNDIEKILADIFHKDYNNQYAKSSWFRRSKG